MSENHIKLIVGLGNPGIEYSHTRHNIGFDVLDLLAIQYHFNFQLEKKFQGEFAKVRISDREVLFLKPTTFMNLSGDAVSKVAQFFKIKPNEILILHDDLDLSPGRIKLKFGGSNGGHNGLKDIDRKLGSNEYYRLRIGIGHPRDALKQNIDPKSILTTMLPNLAKPNVINYVLKKPSSQEMIPIEQGIKKIMSHISLILDGRIEEAQRLLHKLD